MHHVIQAPTSIMVCEEVFLRQVATAPSGTRAIIDMQHMTGAYLKPHDTMLLFLSARVLYQRTGYRVEFANLDDDQLKYLERVDFFSAGADWLFTRQGLDQSWLRNPGSTNCLQLVRVESASDIVNTAVRRVHEIVDMWVGQQLSTDGVDSVVTIVSELCGNAIEHSGECGYLTVQRYQYRYANRVEIHIAVGDLGKGIRRSLVDMYGDTGLGDADYIQLALDGLSARGEGNGGNGLTAVRSKTGAAGSWMRIRSGAGAVHIGAGAKVQVDLPFMGGTQALVVLTSGG